jgi:hypothetical protein
MSIDVTNRLANKPYLLTIEYFESLEVGYFS